MRDPGTEQWFDKEGVQWRYSPSISLDSINRKASLANQARLGVPIQPLMVESYTLALKDGIDFPAIVVYQKPSGYVIIDGNHRVEARVQVERQEADAYIVETDDHYVVERLTRTANARNGQPFSHQEKLEHAKHLVRTYGRTRQEVAGLFHLNTETLNAALRADEARDTVRRMGVKGDNIKSSGTWTRLSAISNANVLAAAVKVVDSTSMPTEMVNNLVVDVRKELTEEAQLTKVTEWAQKPEVVRLSAETRKGRAPVHTEREELFRLLTSLVRLLERYPTATQLHITTPSDVERIQTSSTQVRNLLARVLASVPREVTERLVVPAGR